MVGASEGREDLMSNQEEKKCTKCGSPLKPEGQRGFGSLPKDKCTNRSCPTNQPNRGWGN